MKQPYVYDKYFKRHVPVEFAADGSICRYYIFKEDLPNKAAGYMSIIHDLNECEVALKTLQPLLNDSTTPIIIKSSLYTSTVALYVRCFNKAWGRSASLDKSIFEDCDESIKSFHEEVVNMRNNFVGHAGTSPHETISLILYFHPLSEEVVTSKGSINKHQFGHSIDLFLQLVNRAGKAAGLHEEIISKGREPLACSEYEEPIEKV